MAPIVGIDLGTTNSLIGVMEAGFPLLLANADGERLTPSVVHFPESGEPVAGRAAARMRALDPGNTVASIKRLMGSGGRVTMRGRAWRPEEISALILQKLKQDAVRALEGEVSRAVITVPAYFNDAQRNATKAAGELAGFIVERIVNEPTAAALAYGLDRLGEKSRIAVYDLGGGTFDISILELNKGVFQVIATHGNTRLGGDDIDAALDAHFAEKSGLENLRGSDARIHAVLVTAKHRLSAETETSIELPFFKNAKNVSMMLTRAELEAIARPIVERTRAHCRQALADAKLGTADLDEVILVGGMTRMPMVRKLVGEIFGREPNVSQNPDEAVALGATIQAGILSGAVRNMV
ncbi:MAG: molecular chaperone DnaK, partial [Chthoniobacter sp.]|nr:molecular chaperone DnaK [Chthoniobacter sp.]